MHFFGLYLFFYTERWLLIAGRSVRQASVVMRLSQNMLPHVENCAKVKHRGSVLGDRQQPQSSDDVPENADVGRRLALTQNTTSQKIYRQTEVL